MMNFSNPKKLVIFLAVVSTLLFYILVFTFFFDAEWWQLIFSGVFFFAVVYILYYNLIKRFIVAKIKGVYKSITTHKSDELIEEEIKQSWKNNPLETASEKVEEWSERQKSELVALQKQEKFRRDFLGNVAHELKTPVFNLQGYILTLLDGGLEDETINIDYLKRAAKNAERMINILEDLDEISKLDSGELGLNKSIFNITQLADEVVHSQELRAKKKDMAIKLDLSESYEVFADKEKIRQVLVNLVVNAIKYGEQGGWVKIQFSEMDKVLMVEVEDNGIGIEEKHLPRLFERFYRVDESRSRELGGSGLGLAIVKHIVEAHHQKVGVRSTVAVGTVFYFTLELVEK